MSIEALRARVSGLFAVGAIKSITDDGTRQTAQIEVFNEDTDSSDVHDDCEVWQPAGLATRPSAGWACVALFPDGSRSNTPIVIAIDTGGARPVINEGEAALYAEDDGDDDATAHRVALTDQGVELRGSAVHAGTPSATAPVTLAQPLTTFLNSLLTYIGGLSSSPGGGPLIPPGPAPTVPTLATTKLKAE